MKKILSLVLVVLMATTVSAKKYQHSIGMVAGLGIGAQYKAMLTDHFTLILEEGYFMNLNGGTEGGAYAGAVTNGVFAYQSKITEGQGIQLDYYAGGQMKIGYVGMQGFDVGVFGISGAVGLEANMVNAPIAFSFDFRPGYAFLFTGQGAGGHMFDYSFNLGVRYTF